MPGNTASCLTLCALPVHYMSTSATGLWDCGHITDLADTIKHLPWRLDQSKHLGQCVEQTAGVISHTHTEREREVWWGQDVTKKKGRGWWMRREWVQMRVEERIQWGRWSDEETKRVGGHWKQETNNREREREGIKEKSIVKLTDKTELCPIWISNWYAVCLWENIEITLALKKKFIGVFYKKIIFQFFCFQMLLDKYYFIHYIYLLFYFGNYLWN